MLINKEREREREREKKKKKVKDINWFKESKNIYKWSFFLAFV